MRYQHPLRKLARHAADFLTFNRTERRGILVLSVLLTGVILANALIPAGTFRDAPPQTGDFAHEVAAFETAWKAAADSDSIARISRYAGKYPKATGPGDGPTPAAYPSRPVLMLELNSSDTLDLQQLRGIGPGFARRIVQYRLRLRGYDHKMQLLEVFGMDSSRYRMIEGQVYVNRDSVKPFDLNTVTLKELLRHPYFPFAAAKNILLYRQKNKVIRSVEELRGIPAVTDSLFVRMVRYVRL